MSRKIIQYCCLYMVLMVNTACGFIEISPLGAPPTKTPLHPTPTLFADFDNGDPFDCWTETALKSPISMANGNLFILSEGANNRSLKDLYRYSLEDQKYEKVASNLFGLHAMYEGMVLSPGRDAFWYLAEGSSGAKQVFVYRQATGKPQEVPLIAGYDTPPPGQWSAKGSCLLFPGPQYLTAYQLSDGKYQRKQVPGMQLGQRVAVSPSGKWWATTQNDGNDQGIILFDLAGSQIKTPAAVTQYGSDQLSWSPDGEKLAFAFEWSQYQAYFLENVRLLTFHADGNISFLDIGKYSHYVKIDWSPDSHFLYLSTSVDKDRIQIYDAIKMEHVAVPIPLKNIDHISLSPDGNQVLAVEYMEDRRKGSPLFLYDLITGEKRVLPLPPEYDNNGYFYINAIFWLAE